MIQQILHKFTKPQFSYNRFSLFFLCAKPSIHFYANKTETERISKRIISIFECYLTISDFIVSDRMFSECALRTESLIIGRFLGVTQRVSRHSQENNNMKSSECLWGKVAKVCAHASTHSLLIHCVHSYVFFGCKLFNSHVLCSQSAIEVLLPLQRKKSI